MKLFSLLAVVIYCAISLLMGLRLLLLAKRTREVPELMIGAAFLSGGMIGYPFNVAASVLVQAGKPGAASVAYVVGQAGMALSAFFLLLSWRRIFVPTGLGALAFVVGWSVFVFATLLAILQHATPGSIEHLKAPVYWSALLAQGGCYAVLGWTSFRHGRMLERRLAIGLADPVIANRLFLWGYSNVSITISYLYAFIAGLLLRNDMLNIYQPSIISALGMTSAFFVTLAFFPPKAYLAKIRANAPVAGGA
jgi:hypothetical protein